MGLFSKTLCGLCGNKIKGQYVQVHQMNSKGENIKLLYNICLDCNRKFRMATQDKVPYPVTPEEAKLLIKKGTNAAGVIEKRVRCNVCGNVFCYSDKDLARNKELREEAQRAAKMAALESIGGTRIAANQKLSAANESMSKIVDYSKCPKCNSTDLVTISEDEFKAFLNNKASANNTELPSPTSSADELKKFKELLDAGVITQEEFDAKKKQILGLSDVQSTEQEKPRQEYSCPKCGNIVYLGDATCKNCGQFFDWSLL